MTDSERRKVANYVQGALDLMKVPNGSPLAVSNLVEALEILNKAPRVPDVVARIADYLERGTMFEGIDVSVEEALDAYFSHGYDGGSFVTALLNQDYRQALLAGHEHLSRMSIIRHMDLAKKMIDEVVHYAEDDNQDKRGCDETTGLIHCCMSEVTCRKCLA